MYKNFCKAWCDCKWTCRTNKNKNMKCINIFSSPLFRQVCPSASAKHKAASAVPLPACRLHWWRLPAGWGGAEVIAGVSQDNCRAPRQSPWVPASLAAAHLLCTQAEQSHYQTLHRYPTQFCLLITIKKKFKMTVWFYLPSLVQLSAAWFVYCLF